MAARYLEVLPDMLEAVDDPIFLAHMPPLRGAAAAPIAALPVEDEALAQPPIRRTGLRTSGQRRRTARALEAEKAAEDAATAAAVAAATRELYTSEDDTFFSEWEKLSPAKKKQRTAEIRNLIKSPELKLTLEQVVQICDPAVKVLRLADSNEPCISKMYYRCWEVSETYRAMGGSEEALEGLRKRQSAAWKAKQKPLIGQRSSPRNKPRPPSLEVPQFDPDLAKQLVQMWTHR